jgi:hypothetical protein
MELIRYTESGIYFYDVKSFLPQKKEIKVVKINDIDVEIKEYAREDVTSADIDGLGTFKFSPAGYFTFYPQTEGDLYEGLYIKIEIEFASNNDTAQMVENMRFGVPYGTYGFRDRLFLSGNPEYPNLDIHSCETSDSENRWRRIWRDRRIVQKLRG